MNNHYVSKFIIKRFSKVMNVFDLQKGKIEEKKKPDKIFCKKDIFTDEIEKLCCENIESKVANILDKKISVCGTVVLTRDELYTIKRYMLICSVRTQTPEDFCSILKTFKNKADLYFLLNKLPPLPTLQDLNLSPKDLYLRTLKVFSETYFIRDIYLNSLATREMLAWAMPFLESYLAFWDAPDDFEFVLTDCGMCSEYEGIHMLTGGLDVSKSSYLMNQIRKGKEYCIPMMIANYSMYENYDIYNLNSKRCMLMIHPFFRLYSKKDYYLNGKKTIIDEPDIWPAIIQDRFLFEVPSTKYVAGDPSTALLSFDDEFFYTPKQLSKQDLVYINSILLSQAKEIIGFNDSQQLLDSIAYLIWASSNFQSVQSLKQTEEETFRYLVENIQKSTFNKLAAFCLNSGAKFQLDFISLFENTICNIFKDLNNNPYICDYFLENAQRTVECEVLNFLGKGEKKLEFFRNLRKKIMEKRKNETV